VSYVEADPVSIGFGNCRCNPAGVTHLGKGGLLAYPTETVYGLGSRTVQADVAALAAMKGRSASKPFLLLISDREWLRRMGWHSMPPPMRWRARSGPALSRSSCPAAPAACRISFAGQMAACGALDLAPGDRRISGRARLATHVHIGESARPAAGPGADAIARDFATAVTSGQLLVLDGGVLGNGHLRRWLIAPGHGRRSCAKAR